MLKSSFQKQDQMWRIILLTTLLHTVAAMSRPVERIEGPFWPIRNGFRFSSRQQELTPSILRQRFAPYTTDDRGNEFELLPSSSGEKRGFSMLARWRPFNSIGSQRSSIREHNNRIAANTAPMSDLDIVSAETRALLRPVGQPLRWG